MKSLNSSGQSLLEVIVAFGVATLVLTSLVAAVVVAIRNTRFAKNQALATKLAQEGIEKVRVYRDQTDNWDTFKANCGNESAVGFTSLPSPFASFSTDPIRCVEDDSPDKVRVTVTISWSEGERSHKSQLTTYLTKWE